MNAHNTPAPRTDVRTIQTLAELFEHAAEAAADHARANPDGSTLHYVEAAFSDAYDVFCERFDLHAEADAQTIDAYVSPVVISAMHARRTDQDIGDHLQTIAMQLFDVSARAEERAEADMARAESEAEAKIERQYARHVDRYGW